MMGDNEESLTMWSESLMESLYVALRKRKSDDILKQIIGELKAKGYNDKYLVNLAREKVGPRAGTRLTGLLGLAESGEKKEEAPSPIAMEGARGVSRPAKKVRARDTLWSERARRSRGDSNRQSKKLGFFSWLKDMLSR